MLFPLKEPVNLFTTLLEIICPHDAVVQELDFGISQFPPAHADDGLSWSQHWLNIWLGQIFFRLSIWVAETFRRLQ